MSARVVCTAVLLLAGCRFGGPSGSATSLTEPFEAAVPASDASGDAGQISLDGGPSEQADADLPDADADAAELDSGEDGAVIDSGSACVAGSVAGCDPVRGTGCTPGLSQCVVDREAVSPSGRCVFSAAQLSLACEEGPISSTCPMLFGCVQGQCHKYCYCDADCDSGDSCAEASDHGASAQIGLCLTTHPVLDP